MSIRVDVQLDHGSESLRWIATATLDGKHLHEVGKYGGPEVCDELLIEMAAWLKGQEHPVPDVTWFLRWLGDPSASSTPCSTRE